MAELNERDTKLVQYLNEAYGKEKQLETALEAHIAMTTRAPYKKRLQAHLKETKAHARDVERRIKKLGGQAGGDGVVAAASTLQTAANKAARSSASSRSTGSRRSGSTRSGSTRSGSTRSRATRSRSTARSGSRS